MFLLIWGAGHGTQGIMHARQVLHPGLHPKPLFPKVCVTLGVLLFQISAFSFPASPKSTVQSWHSILCHDFRGGEERDCASCESDLCCVHTLYGTQST